jgi:hypothetical protein
VSKDGVSQHAAAACDIDSRGVLYFHSKRLM